MMFDTMYVLRHHSHSSYVCHKQESWFPNSQKNWLSYGENQKSVGCVLTELQWLVETCPIIDTGDKFISLLSFKLLIFVWQMFQIC